VRPWVDKLLNLFFVPKCVACRQVLGPDGGALCPACLEKYEDAKERRCACCLAPLSSCACPTEYLSRHGVRRLVKVFRYRPKYREEPENKLIYALKSAHLRDVNVFLAKELAAALRGQLPKKTDQCLITNIPASARARLHRGYDHAAALARLTGRELGIAYDDLLCRTRAARAQKELDGAQRLENIKGLFAVKKGKAPANKVVILVDDITTSGATLAEAAKTIKKAGAKRVLPAVLGVGSR